MGSTAPQATASLIGLVLRDMPGIVLSKGAQQFTIEGKGK
jgi:hypothetical protein